MILQSLKIIFEIKTYLVTLISNLIGILFFPNIFKINDISDKDNKTLVENQTDQYIPIDIQLNIFS
jgi:hypothetical protein